MVIIKCLGHRSGEIQDNVVVTLNNYAADHTGHFTDILGSLALLHFLGPWKLWDNGDADGF